MSETLDLEKTRQKLKNALENEKEGRIRISQKLARSIDEHLWRLSDLDK